MRRSLKCLSALAAAASVALMGCGFPYEPEQQGQPIQEQPPQPEGGAVLYLLNGGEQICNASVSQNETYFPGCMMFLNLGTMAVESDSFPGWPTSITQHDRLCVVDTANEVRWYMMKPSFVGRGIGQMQDPEWSTHNNYATFLGDEGANKVYGYVVRISDKMVLRVHKNLILTSTPFVWLPDTAGDVAPVTSATPVSAPENDTATYDADSVISKAAITSFFGTSNVKFAFSNRVGNGYDIFYIDYNEATPQVRHLPRPAGIEATIACESPLISPDGKWVTFQGLNNEAAHTAWIQRLDPSASAISLGTAGEILTEPHWWQSPYQVGNPLYVTYCTNRQFTNPLSITDSAGKEGWTYIRQVNIPSSASITSMPLDQLLGTQDVLAGMPLQGGRSRSGTYYATGYMKAYLYQFESIQL